MPSMSVSLSPPICDRKLEVLKAPSFTAYVIHVPDTLLSIHVLLDQVKDIRLAVGQYNERATSKVERLWVGWVGRCVVKNGS